MAADPAVLYPAALEPSGRAVTSEGMTTGMITTTDRYHANDRVEIFDPQLQRAIPGTVLAATVTTVLVSLDDRMVSVAVDPADSFRIHPLRPAPIVRRHCGRREPVLTSSSSVAPNSPVL